MADLMTKYEESQKNLQMLKRLSTAGQYVCVCVCVCVCYSFRVAASCVRIEFTDMLNFYFRQRGWELL